MKPERLNDRIPVTNMSRIIVKPPMGENRIVEVYVDEEFSACLDDERGG